ncbi:MAG: ABC transporter substrate-binding protein [Candidatus Sumerlaeia bacterium]
MYRHRLSILILAVAVMLGVLVAGSWNNAWAQDSDSWKLGVIMPLSGNLAAYGESTLEGVKLMTEKINAAGGIDGKRIELVVENNEGKTVKSAEALRKLVGLNQVLAIIGPITSTNTMFITRDAQNKKVLLITPTGTNDKITGDGDFIFRSCFNDSFQGIAVAKFAREDLKLESAVAFQDTASDYSVGLCKSFEETFSKLGGEVKKKESYKTKDTDFTAQLRKIRRSRADGLFVPGYPPELPLIVNQASNMKLQCVLLGADGWDNNDTVQNAGVNLDGSYFSAAFSAEVSSPALDAFLAICKENNIENPGSFEALGYDSLGLVAEAIDQADLDGKDVEAQRQLIRDKMAAIQDYKGATGSITMQASGDPVKSLVILQYKADGGTVKKAFVKVVEP